MYRILYPLKDTTIYDRFPERNTGIDQILELTKITEGDSYQTVLSEDATWEETYNSRILLKFDITPIQTIFTESIVSQSQVFLQLTATEAQALQLDYTIYGYPIKEDWKNGSGNYNDIPQVSNGATWYWRNGETANDSWSVSSGYEATYISGGGSWHTSSFSTQSFSYDDPNINMNVTTIVNSWLSGSFSNNGIILKHATSEETDDNVYGTLKFFSKDTHTIYLPKLVMYYSEPIYSGSFSTASIMTNNDEYVIHARNLKSNYKEFDDHRIRFNIRELYPARTYQSSSIDYLYYRLPSTSYYSIVDSVTGLPIIDFNEIGTKMQMDDYGHYIRLNFINFMPERYYKIIYKVVSNGETKIHDPNHHFKIAR